MIIDVHSHLRERNDAACAWWLPGEPQGPLPIERFMVHLEREPLDHVLLSSHPRANTPEDYRYCNDQTARAALLNPRLVSGLCQISPQWPDFSLEEIDRWFATRSRQGMVGLGELCGYQRGYENDDPGFDPILERTVELNLPVQLHASTEAHCQAVGRLAARHPEAKLIMAHVGGMYGWPHGVEIARRHPNIRVDTSGFVMLRSGAMERTIEALGVERVLFGVDFPEVIAGPLVRALKDLRLAEDEYARIAWRNAAELFGIETDGKNISGEKLARQGGANDFPVKRPTP
jgi:uncharacterized protein